VWKLQLRRPEKIGVTIAFCLGFFVVFASAYRFTVLFSYSNNDPTYSLAPTVGWTAIEMSAGIVSACLPTLGPVMALLARKVGIKRTVLTSRTGGGSGRGGGTNATAASSSHNFAKSSSLSASAAPSLTDAGRAPPELELQQKKSSRKDGAGAFYRLPDDQQLSADMPRPMDAELRPGHGYAYTVTSRPGDVGRVVVDGAESLSGDEVPLHGIRVHRDFKRSEV